MFLAYLWVCNHHTPINSRTFPLPPERTPVPTGSLPIFPSPHPSHCPVLGND